MTSKTVKHILGNGEEQTYTRLYADPGKVLTNDNGATVWNCIDVSDVTGWVEIDEPTEEDDSEATDEEIAEALEGIV